MPITYINRQEDVYYLHRGTTKTGKPNWYFSMRAPAEGEAAVEEIPAGFEIYEDYRGLVFLRRCLPKLITDEELNVIRVGMQRAAAAHWIVDRKKEVVTIYTDANQHILPRLLASLGVTAEALGESARSYRPMMQLVLIDRETREFRLDRWCFRGSIDGWIVIDTGALPELVPYLRVLGTDGFYELY